MGKGSSKLSGGGGSQPKSQRDIQIDYLEQSIWHGSGKALNPSQVGIGDFVEGVQYIFEPDILTPTRKKSVWSGNYQGIPMKFSADNTYEVTSVTTKGNSTVITANKVGGAGGTAKKTIPNDVYLHVWKKVKK